MNNAQRIRSMNDEELQSFLLEHEYENCKHCIYVDCDDCVSNDDVDCRIGLLKWLQSEVSE